MLMAHSLNFGSHVFLGNLGWLFWGSQLVRQSWWIFEILDYFGGWICALDISQPILQRLFLSRVLLCPPSLPRRPRAVGLEEAEV